MKRPVQPATPLGWWAFRLGFATVVWGRVFPTLLGLLGPLFPGAVRELVLALAAFGMGATAIRMCDSQRPRQTTMNSADYSSLDCPDRH